MRRINLKKALCLGLSISMIAVMAGCGSEADSKEVAVETAAQEVTTITVTLMNQDETLGTLSGKAGELLTGYEAYETIDGTEFLGWFETPTFLETSKKDLAVDTFDADTTLYGSFKSLSVSEDTRKWYVVGSGKGAVLSATNWAGSVDDSVKEAAELTLTGNATNEFQITLDLYSGDQFQVIHDWAWDGQMGYGYVTECDATQMENGGGLGGSTYTSNINVIMDGNYTITLTTDPDNDAEDTFTIVRNGDPTGEVAETEETPYEVTDATGVVVKGSWVDDWSENKDLTRIDGTDSFEITMDLDAGIELYFMIYDNGEDTGLGINAEGVVDDASKALLEEAYNVKVKDAGTYTFTVDADSMTITITK